jgi:hypothetical protein
MQLRRPLIALVAALLLALPLSMPVAAQPSQGSLPVPITQALTGVGTLTGQLVINSFRVVDGQVTALGTLTGRITDTAGNLLGTVATPVAVPVTGTGSCTVLHLTLGPLDLDLLGLQVHLDRVVLDISAQPGAGNLLGNLLCSVANLLNGGGPLQPIVNALNHILAGL